LRQLVNSINRSTPKNFFVNSYLPVGFKIDEMMTIFQQPRFAKIPLIQAILHLSEFLEAYLDVHRQINDDNYIKQFPQEWSKKKANVSASGLAVLIQKRFELYSKVEVYLYFDSSNKSIHFSGSVVDLRDDDASHKERIAINFEFPDGTDQNFLQQEIQKQEVKECMQFVLYP
jgi:hypothetical protein